MPSPFHGINMASQALRTFQRALDVTGHNIANVNTPGYSRQTLDFAANEPSLFWQGGMHALGNGVTLGSITRVRDMFLDARRMGAQADLGRTDTMANMLRQVESLFLETGGGGISDALTKFFNAWSGLASNPSDPAMRMQVQTSGQSLADKIRSRYLDLQALKGHVTTQIDDTLGQVDGLTTRIADLNKQIREQKVGGAEPNDLMDQRDKAVEELSGLIDITTHTFEDGTLTVYTSNLTLVDPVGMQPIPKTYDVATSSLTIPPNSYRVDGGRLAGLFQAHNDIAARQANLDSLANTLRTQVNTLHTTGTNPLGNVGVNFFNDAVPPAPQTGAIDFDLDPAVKANANAIAAGASGAAGDGGIALALSNMRETTQATLGNKSFGQFFTDFVADIGTDAAYYKASLDTQNSIVQQIDAQIQSVSGVSLDDEMANMLRFQRSFQAAARALSVMDQMTEDLIGMLRR